MRLVTFLSHKDDEATPQAA